LQAALGRHPLIDLDFRGKACFFVHASCVHQPRAGIVGTRNLIGMKP
jgi:hypothetical protein